MRIGVLKYPDTKALLKNYGTLSQTRTPELKEYPYQIWNFYDSKECSGIADKIINRTIGALHRTTLDFFDANHEPIPEVGQYNVICCSGEAIGIAKPPQSQKCVFVNITKHMR